MVRPTIPIQETTGGCELTILARPRARRTEFAGTHDGLPCVRLHAPPAEGRANAELLRFLAEELGLPKSAVTLTRGASSRRKVLFVRGLTATGLTLRINDLQIGE